MAARLDSASMFGTRVPAPEKSRQFGIFTHSALKTAICSEYGKFRFEELKLCTYKNIPSLSLQTPFYTPSQDLCYADPQFSKGRPFIATALRKSNPHTLYELEV